MTKGRFPGPIHGRGGLVITLCRARLPRGVVLQVPLGNARNMGQIERFCNRAADRFKVGRRQDRHDELPLGAFHAVQAGERDGGQHVAFGPAAHARLAGEGVRRQLVVMVL